ncbi:MAG TPA: purine-nucleoside phosphorylase [Candidatus Baltobacteraceae bacterium]|nr:purine-nucleoside phosphorylase [Candidatus Baltobacteraceae bacterium]
MKKLAAAAARLQRRARGPLDVAIVLGSGLSGAARERIDGVALGYERLGAPRAMIPGHPGLAFVGSWAGKRVVAFAGRVHRYEGYSARAITYFVRVAAAAGARTVVLTNAAGGLNEALAPGDVMLISDHLNLTGTSPLDVTRDARPFLNMVDAYAPHLRTLARAHADGTLHEGVYAGVAGPAYETPAEAQALRRLGADAVGMSTVLETIAARSLGLEVLGISLITNVVGPTTGVSHEEVLAGAEAGAARIAQIIEGVLAAL